MSSSARECRCRATGARAYQEVFATLHRAYPDLHITVEDMVAAEDDKVVVRNTVTRHSSGWLSRTAANGHPRYITARSSSFASPVARCVAETWGIVDVLTQMRQLDAAVSDQKDVDV